jgi:hypothetical protein
MRIPNTPRSRCPPWMIGRKNPQEIVKPAVVQVDCKVQRCSLAADWPEQAAAAVDQGV